MKYALMLLLFLVYVVIQLVFWNESDSTQTDEGDEASPRKKEKRKMDNIVDMHSSANTTIDVADEAELLPAPPLTKPRASTRRIAAEVPEGKAVQLDLLDSQIPEGFSLSETRT